MMCLFVLLLLSQGYLLPLLPRLNILPISMFLLEGVRLMPVRSYFQLSLQVLSLELQAFLLSLSAVHPQLPPTNKLCLNNSQRFESDGK